MNNDVSPFSLIQYQTLTLLANEMAHNGFYFNRQNQNNQYTWARLGLLERLVCWIKSLFGSDSGQESCVRKTIFAAKVHFGALPLQEKNLDAKFSEYFFKPIKEGHFSQSTKKIVDSLQWIIDQSHQIDKTNGKSEKKLEEKGKQKVDQVQEPITSSQNHQESTTEMIDPHYQVLIEQVMDKAESPVKKPLQQKSEHTLEVPQEKQSKQVIEQTLQGSTSEVSNDKTVKSEEVTEKSEEEVHDTSQGKSDQEKSEIISKEESTKTIIEDTHQESTSEVSIDKVTSEEAPQKAEKSEDVVQEIAQEQPKVIVQKEGQSEQIEATLEELRKQDKLTPCILDNDLIEELAKKKIIFHPDGLKTSKDYLLKHFMMKEFLFRLPPGMYYFLSGNAQIAYANGMQEFITCYKHALKKNESFPIPVLLQKKMKPSGVYGPCQTFIIDKTNDIQGAYLDNHMVNDSIPQKNQLRLQSFDMFCFPDEVHIKAKEAVQSHSYSLKSIIDFNEKIGKENHQVVSA